MNPGCGKVLAGAGRDIRNGGTPCPSQPGSYQHRAVSPFTFHQQRARDQELLGKQWELVSAARHPSLAAFLVGTGVQGCTNTPKWGGNGYWILSPGFPEIPMSSSQLTRIPSQKRIPLATGREGFLCSDSVRMIPKQMWTIPVKMWMVWGRMREMDPDPITVRHIPAQSHITVLGRDWERHLSQHSLHPARENPAGQSLRIPNPAGPL